MLSRKFERNISLHCQILKHGRVYLNRVIKDMKTISILFTTNKAEVYELITRVQKTSKQLQRIITSAKRGTKNATITNNAPLVKRALESWLHHTKIMLRSN